MAIITILLTDHAPKALNTDLWTTLLETPKAQAAAQYLGVWVSNRGSRAVVYGHKGAGTEVVGAGLYSGFMTNLGGDPESGLNYDKVAAAILKVGAELCFDKQMLWALIQRLPAQEL